MKLLPNLSKEKVIKFLPWAGIYFAAGLLSLVATHFMHGIKGIQILWVFCLIVPRILSLSLFVIPCQLTPYRYTGTFGMVGLWFLWIGITNHCFWISLIMSVISFGIAFLFFFLKERKNKRISAHKELFGRITILMMFSVLAIFLLEIIQTRSFIIPIDTMIGNPDIFACNLLYFTAIGSFVFWCPKQKSAAIIYLIIWFALGIGSAYKASNLLEPLLLNDVYQAYDGLMTALIFLDTIGIILCAVGVICVLVGIIMLVTMEKGRKFCVNAFWGCLFYFTIALAGVVFCAKADSMKLNYDLPAKEAYEQNGFVYSFMTYSIDTIFPPSDEYDHNVVDDILNKLENTEYEEDIKVKNFIVFQLESFMDPTAIEGAKFERDPLPFLHSLQEQFSSGSIRVPTYGGTTVRSEFEFLSGMSLYLMEDQGGKGFNPYTKYLNKQSVDTFVYALKESGFQATAIHNYQGEFFNRNIVYKNLGFDTFIPLELIPDIQRREGKIWANDAVFLNQIDQVLSASTAERNFIFNVTVQLHGNYPGIPDEEYCMKITGINDEEENDELRGQIAYYVNELESVDDMVRKICQYFEERNEPTYILFYSDHLPNFAQNTAGFEDEDRFNVNYFTWNNIGCEKVYSEVELYRLATQVFDAIGIRGNVINQFHREYSGKNDYKSLLKEIQYYKFFNEYKENKNSEYFKNDGFTIGVVPLVIESISSDLDGGYIIKGTGFTKNVRLLINGEPYEISEENLIFVDANTLKFKVDGLTLSSSDVIVADIIGERSDTIFMESPSYVWPTPEGVVMRESNE